MPITGKNRHGGENREKNIRYDFSVNINPLGLPEAVKKALISDWSIYEEYPDDSCGRLKEALALRYGMDSGRIVCGNGAADLIYRLCVSGGFQNVLLPVPCFTEYQRALEFSDCDVTHLFTGEKSGFVFEEKHLEQITEEYDGLFLCNPGNPAGGLMKEGLLEKIIDRCEKKDVTLVIDECFLDFVKDGRRHSAAAAAAAGKNVIVIKSFTKIFAMAGLRLGFALFGDRESAEKAENWGAPWQVSGPAQAAGLAILEAGPGKAVRAAGIERRLTDDSVGNAQPEEGGWDAFVKRTEAYVREERRSMENSLKESGLKPVKGFANYILFRGPSGLDKLLEKQGIAIRECSDYTGLGAEKIYYRAAVRTREENQALLREIKRCMEWL